MPVSVLLSQPDKKTAEEMRDYLRLKSFEVDSAKSGKDCQLKIYQGKFLIVVLDIDTENHSGLEVLRYIRLNSPSTKIILTVCNKDRLRESNLAANDLRKLGASDILIRPFSNEALLESIEGVNQYESWKEIKGKGPQGEEEQIEASDSEFTRIKIEDFYSGNATIFDCYVKLSKNTYVKILHKGDFFEPKRIEKYKAEKKITHLYFKTSDRTIYINFINSVLEKVVNKDSTKRSVKAKAAKNLVEKYVEEIYTEGLKPQLIDEGRRICQNVYNLIKRDPDLSSLMSMYEDYDPPAFGHLFLVSFLSTIICKNLEWASQRTVELISFGSLLHDIGKLKFPEELRDKMIEDMDPEEILEYKKHPYYGAEMLQQYPLVSEPIRQIVFQHHEYINGEGFPNGLTDIKIYPLAKVVSLSDEFAYRIVNSEKKPIAALKGFISDRSNIVHYDPMIVKALIQGFVKDKA